MDDIYKNVENYNTNKKLKILFFDDMIADMLSNKNNDSNSSEFFGTVPKSSTMSRSPEIQFTCPELKLFLPLWKKTLNFYSFIHQTCSTTN